MAFRRLSRSSTNFHGEQYQIISYTCVFHSRHFYDVMQISGLYNLFGILLVIWDSYRAVWILLRSILQKNLAGDRKKCYTPPVSQFQRSPFFGNLKMRPFLQSCGITSIFHILLKRSVCTLVAVVISHFSISSCIASIRDALPLCMALMFILTHYSFSVHPWSHGIYDALLVLDREPAAWGDRDESPGRRIGNGRHHNQPPSPGDRTNDPTAADAVIGHYGESDRYMCNHLGIYQTGIYVAASYR